jgi:hypothetical protein
MQFFGGDHGKTFTEIKTHLVTKITGGAGSRPVSFGHAFVEDQAQ